MTLAESKGLRALSQQLRCWPWSSTRRPTRDKRPRSAERMSRDRRAASAGRAGDAQVTAIDPAWGRAPAAGCSRPAPVAWAGEATAQKIASAATRPAAEPRRNDPLLPITPYSPAFCPRVLLLNPVPGFVVY